jgi:plasmid stability protein
MAQVIVRNLEDDVVERLKLKAELHGRSLEQELREILRAAAPLTGEQKLALMRRSQALTPKGVKQTPSEVLIREDRDDPDR